jgi:hypothetical protein
MGTIWGSGRVMYDNDDDDDKSCGRWCLVLQEDDEVQNDEVEDEEN